MYSYYNQVEQSLVESPVFKTIFDCAVFDLANDVAGFQNWECDSEDIWYNRHLTIKNGNTIICTIGAHYFKKDNRLLICVANKGNACVVRCIDNAIRC